MKAQDVKVGMVVKDKTFGYVRVVSTVRREGNQHIRFGKLDWLIVERSEGLGLADSPLKDLRPLTAREKGLTK